MSADDRARVARRAALRRWTRERFGAESFAELGLPGGEIVDRGIDDLAAGVESVESLLISVAAPRLRREGVPLPRHTFDESESRLYRAIERESPSLAHARYLAYLEQASSFADACHGRRAR